MNGSWVFPEGRKYSHGWSDAAVHCRTMKRKSEFLSSIILISLLLRKLNNDIDRSYRRYQRKFRRFMARDNRKEK